MIRTGSPPTLLHGSGEIDADGHCLPESFPCLSADKVCIPPLFGLPPSSPLHPPSSPSAFTSSISSNSSKLRSPSSRSWAPYRRPGALLSESLELRFTEKTLRPGGDSGLFLGDVKKGQPLLSAGLKRLTNEALEEAVLMKHASRETRRFRALASAWELKGARHYSNYLTCVHKGHQDEFTSEDLALDNLMKFRHESYNEDLLSVAVANAQLDSIEAEIESRTSSSEPSSSASSSLPSSPSRDFVPPAGKNEDTDF